MTLFEYVRRHAKAILFTIVVLSIAGLALMLGMPVSLFPDVTFPRIVLKASLAGLTTVDVQEQVETIVRAG